MGQMNNDFQKRREEKIRELRKRLQEEGYAEFYIKSYIKGFFIGYHQSLAEFVRKEVLTVDTILYMFLIIKKNLWAFVCGLRDFFLKKSCF